jgi:Tfp pilus assembly protein PilF
VKREALYRIALRLALLAGAVGPFANGLGNDWVYDDRAQVVRNQLVRSLAPGPIFAGGSVTHGRVEWYRPLTVYSFAVNYSLSGLDPFGYHLTNVALHAANVFLVLKVGERLAAPGPAALAAALFAVHAVHTEAVTPVSGRADLLAALFVLLAWWLALATSTSLWRPPVVGLLFLAGLLAKESAVALLPLVAASDILGRPLARRRAVYAALFSGLAAYLTVRYTAVGSLFTWGTIRYIENPLVEAGTVSRVITAFWIVLRYLGLFLLPHPLSADYSYNQISVISDWRDPRLLGVLFGIVFAIGLIVWFWRRSRGATLCLLALGILLAPVGNFFFPIGTIMAERLLYLPSVPLSLLAGLAAARAAAGPVWRRTLVSAAIVLALAGNLGAAVARNRDWRSDEALFAATVGQAPRSAKAHFNYGSLLLEKGETEKAEPLLRKAVAIAPSYPEAHNLLGTIHLARGELAEAERAFRVALADAPEYAPALGNLGMTLVRQSRWEEAEKALRQAVARDPSLAVAYLNLGLLAEIRQDFAEAIVLYRRAYSIDPGLQLARSRAEALAENR